MDGVCALEKEINVAKNFGWALAMLKNGWKLTRSGWNGKGIWVVYQKGYPEGVAINKNTAEATKIAEGTVMKFKPYLMIKNVHDEFVPYTPNQSDILAEDWEIV